MGRIDAYSVDRLTAKNESLQRKISSLESELRDRDIECSRLRDQLRQIDTETQQRVKDNSSSVSTEPTELLSSFSSDPSHLVSCNSTGGIEVDHRPPLARTTLSTDSGSFSNSNITRNESSKTESDLFPFGDIEKQYSKDSIFAGLNDGFSTKNVSVAFSETISLQKQFFS